MGAVTSDFTVTFDQAILVPNGATFGAVGNSNGGGRTLNVTNPIAGTLVVSITGGNQFVGSGALVNLNFNVAGLPGDSSQVDLVSFQYNEGPPCGIANNGRVSVVSGTLSGTVAYGNILGPPAPRPVPSVTLDAPGAPAVSTVTNASGAYTLSNFGAGSYTITPSKSGGVNGAISAFDAAKIAQNVVNMIPFNPIQTIVADVSGADSVTSFDAVLVARYVVLLPPPAGFSSATGNWIFGPSSRTYPNVFANISNEDYAALLMGDVTGNWNDPIALPERSASGPQRSIAIAAPRIVTQTEKEIVVPISVQGAPGRGIIAYEFDLKYDPTVIQPLTNPVSVAGTASRGLNVVANPTQPGSLKVAVYGTMPISENGVLLNLRFTAIGEPGAVSKLEWENLMVNEGNPRVLPVDGQVEIQAAGPNQAEVSGRLLTAYGSSVPNTRVTLTDLSGKSMSVISDESGAYRFTGLQLGESYTISVASRRWMFTPITVSVTGQTVNVDLTAANEDTTAEP